MRDRVIKKGQIMYYPGETPSGVNEIKSGVMRAYSILTNGSEVNVALHGKGDYFPIETAYDISPVAVFYYEALTNCKVENQSLEDFQAQRRQDPDTPFIDSRRYVGALMHVSAMGQATAYEKLGHTLRYLGMRFGKLLADERFVRINMKLTQQDLANLCALARETVNIELLKLKDTGLVIEKNKVYAVNLSGLNTLLGEEDVDLSL